MIVAQQYTTRFALRAARSSSKRPPNLNNFSKGNFSRGGSIRNFSGRSVESAFGRSFTSSSSRNNKLRNKLITGLCFANGGFAVMPSPFGSPLDTDVLSRAPTGKLRAVGEDGGESVKEVKVPSTLKTICRWLCRLRRFLQGAWRVTVLSFRFVPIIATWPLALSPFENFWWGWLMGAMERSGPAFIKFAQWAATREDYFPLWLTERLSQFHSSVKEHSIESTRETLEHSFGEDWYVFFLSFFVLRLNFDSETKFKF